MKLSRRSFIRGTGASLALAGLMNSTAIKAVMAATEGVKKIFHATHYGAFHALVKDGKMIGIETIKDIDARPTAMLTEGVLDRTYHRTRVKYPMVRKSYLENWDKADRKVELRGKEPFVRVDWDTALKLTVKAILDTIDKHGNEGVFSSSYGGWSHAGLMRPNVLQGKFYNLLGGSSMTVGDWSAGASQISLPHIIGDMEVYSPQSSWETVRDNSEVVVWVGCDPFKNNRIEYRVADHQMYPRWEEIRDKGIKFISINPQFSPTDQWVKSEWVKIVPNTDVALFSAMAYQVYTKGMHDQAFMDKYTVGASKWLDYVTGKEDGVKKTPAWASKITGIEEAKITEMAEMFATRNSLRPSRKSSVPGPHSGLGMDCYIQATSPLRRYLDLVAHQQLRAHVLGETTLSNDEIINRVGAVESMTGSVRQAERDSRKHWTLVFLMQNPDWIGEGVVVSRRGLRHICLIPELALEVGIYPSSELDLDTVVNLKTISVDLPNLQVDFLIVE